MSEPHPRRANAWRTIRRSALCAALVVTGVATIGSATASAAPAPSQIAGDPHSTKVAELATEALDAQLTWRRTRQSEDEAQYVDAVEATADATAREFGVSQGEMRNAWIAADLVHQTAVLTALTQLGAPYRTNSSDPETGFDCSGLTSFAWREAGYELPHQSGAQISAADGREPATAMAGDLAQYPGHVMMYLGVPRTFVHAANPAKDVELSMTSEDKAASLRYGDPTVAD